MPWLENAHDFTGNILPAWAWGALALLPLLMMHRQVDAWFSQNRTAGVWVAGLVCAGASLAALSANLDARLGAIDDHEIVAFMHPGHAHASWRELPTMVAHSDAASFGAAGRYLPLFTTARLAQCCAWGREAGPWYGTLMVLCMLALVLLWRILQPWWGATLSFAFAVFILGLPAIGDTYARLGSAEAYALPPFLLGVWAWCKAARRSPSAAALWWLGAFGFGAAELCKENFVLLAALAVAVAALGLWRAPAGNRAGAWSAVGALTVVTLVMCGIVGRMVLTTGKDFYGNDMNAASTLHGMGHAGVRLFLTLCPLLGWLAFAMRKMEVRTAQAALKKLGKFVLPLGAAVAVWFSQAAFYRNVEWPGGTRYDLPGLLVPLLVLVSAAVLLLRLVKADGWRRLGEAGLIVLLLIGGGDGVVHHTIAQSRLNASRTSKFSKWINDVAREAKARPDAPLILVPERAESHYEAVLSVYRYLRYKKVSNRILYSTKIIDAEEVVSTLERNLTQAMKRSFGSGAISGLDRVNDQSWPENALIIPFGEPASLSMQASNRRCVVESFDHTLR